MRNRLLVILIIVAALFPFVATAFELTKNVTALIGLAGLSLVAIAITVGALVYRPKRSADADTPVQAIPTVKVANTQRAASGPPAPNTDAATKPATKPNTSVSTASSKNDPKRQRAR